jgi:hypothetical protein
MYFDKLSPVSNPRSRRVRVWLQLTRIRIVSWHQAPAVDLTRAAFSTPLTVWSLLSCSSTQAVSRRTISQPWSLLPPPASCRLHEHNSSGRQLDSNGGMSILLAHSRCYESSRGLRAFTDVLLLVSSNAKIVSHTINAYSKTTTARDSGIRLVNFLLGSSMRELHKPEVVSSTSTSKEDGWTGTFRRRHCNHISGTGYLEEIPDLDGPRETGRPHLAGD